MRTPLLALEDFGTANPEELITRIVEADLASDRLDAEGALQSQEVERLDENIDNARVVATALSETAERLEAIYPEGVPAEVVATLEPVLEALKNVVGFQPGAMKVSLEGLHGKERTRVTVESLKETDKKIWEAIKAAFNRMVEFVKSLFTRQSKKQEVIKDKIDAALDSWEKAINAEVAQGKVVKFGESEKILYPMTVLTDSGHAPSYQEMDEWLSKDAQMLHRVFGLAGEDVLAFHNLSQDILEKTQTADEVAEELLKWSREANDKMFSEIRHAGGHVEQGEVVVKSKIGGAKGAFSALQVQRDGESTKHPCAALGFKTTNTTADSKTDSQYGPVLTKQQATHLLEKMKKEIESWPDSHKYEKNSRVVTEFREIFEHAVNSSARTDDEKQKMLHLLSDIMYRLRSCLNIMRWSHEATMSVLMGISSVCASSNFSNSMNEHFGK